MLVDGRDFELLRKLNVLTVDVALKEPDLLFLALMTIVRRMAKERISQCHKENAKDYSLRSRLIKLIKGDTVYACSFTQSNAAKKFSCKLPPVFVKQRSTKR